MKKYTITKTYGHELGLSCVFRQWRAPETHCSQLHGYALAFKLTFESDVLDHRNWVISFGELKEVKTWLQNTFDHKTVISSQDPHIDFFYAGHKAKIINLVVVPEVGCEMFAEYVATNVQRILGKKLSTKGARLVSVEVSEHDGNSAIYTVPEPAAVTHGNVFIQGVLAPKTPSYVFNAADAYKDQLINSVSASNDNTATVIPTKQFNSSFTPIVIGA